MNVLTNLKSGELGKLPYSGETNGRDTAGSNGGGSRRTGRLRSVRRSHGTDKAKKPLGLDLISVRSPSRSTDVTRDQTATSPTTRIRMPVGCGKIMRHIRKA